VPLIVISVLKIIKIVSNLIKKNNSKLPKSITNLLKKYKKVVSIQKKILT
jgi:hypothetical protein